jgi:hypothetical protein
MKYASRALLAPHRNSSQIERLNKIRLITEQIVTFLQNGGNYLFTGDEYELSTVASSQKFDYEESMMVRFFSRLFLLYEVLATRKMEDHVFGVHA